MYDFFQGELSCSGLPFELLDSPVGELFDRGARLCVPVFSRAVEVVSARHDGAAGLAYGGPFKVEAYLGIVTGDRVDFLYLLPLLV